MAFPYKIRVKLICVTCMTSHSESAVQKYFLAVRQNGVTKIANLSIFPLEYQNKTLQDDY